MPLYSFRRPYTQQRQRPLGRQMDRPREGFTDEADPMLGLSLIHI